MINGFVRRHTRSYIGTPIQTQALFIGTPKPLSHIVIPMAQIAGQRIRGIRKTLGLTQGELAARAGIKQGTLSELETGVSQRPRGDSLIRIAKALDVDPDWLVTGKGSPARAAKPDEEQQELWAIWSDLSAPNRSALVAAARGLLSSQPKPTKGSPFPAKHRP